MSDTTSGSGDLSREPPPPDDPDVNRAAEPGAEDALVPWRIFLAIGALVTILALIYWFTSYEDAGSVMLALSAVLALWVGLFLWLQWRRPPESADQPVAAMYLPHASVWPFAIGLGTALVANGLVLGIWVIFPGALSLVFGILGFIHQTRQRT
jgi:hypothetical protein